MHNGTGAAIPACLDAGLAFRGTDCEVRVPDPMALVGAVGDFDTQRADAEKGGSPMSLADVTSGYKDILSKHEVAVLAVPEGGGEPAPREINDTLAHRIIVAVVGWANDQGNWPGPGASSPAQQATPSVRPA